MSKRSLQQDLMKLKLSVVNVKKLSQKFKENQKMMEHIVKENNVIVQKLDESNGKMLLSMEEVCVLSDKVSVVEEESSEEWVFPPVVNLKHYSSDGDVDTEKIAGDKRNKNDRPKIQVVSQAAHQADGALNWASSSNVLAESNIIVVDDDCSKGNEVASQMNKIKQNVVRKANTMSAKKIRETVIIRPMSREDHEGNEEEVGTGDKLDNSKGKSAITQVVRKRKSNQMMMNQTGPSKQVVEDRFPSKPKLARTKSVLNQSVIDCEYVLKKRVVKEKQVMTPIKIKAEAAHLPSMIDCNICTKSFTSAAPLAVHLMNHTNGTDLLDCPFSFCIYRGNQLKLTQHMRSKHTNEKLFSCYSCTVKFATLDAKTAHEKKHSQSSLQQCGRCSRFYNVKKGSCRCC